MRPDIIAGPELGINDADGMVAFNRLFDLLEFVFIFADKKVAAVTQVDRIVGNADHFGKVLPDFDGFLGQGRHRRLGKLGPKRFNGCRRCQC